MTCTVGQPTGRIMGRASGQPPMSPPSSCLWPNQLWSGWVVWTPPVHKFVHQVSSFIIMLVGEKRGRNWFLARATVCLELAWTPYLCRVFLLGLRFPPKDELVCLHCPSLSECVCEWLCNGRTPYPVWVPPGSLSWQERFWPPPCHPELKSAAWKILISLFL